MTVGSPAFVLIPDETRRPLLEGSRDEVDRGRSNTKPYTPGDHWQRRIKSHGAKFRPRGATCWNRPRRVDAGRFNRGGVDRRSGWAFPFGGSELRAHSPRTLLYSEAH